MKSLEGHWNDIREHFNRSFRSNFHVSVGSVDDKGTPDVTPIGSLFLNSDFSGFYFEKFPSTITKAEGKKVCILAVNSGIWFWIKSLFTKKFKTYPGLKLYGILGKRREATSKEISRLDRRMKTTKGLKGNIYLWGDMPYVRDISFNRFSTINLGEMTFEINQ
jgi:hypothetical protein